MAYQTLLIDIAAHVGIVTLNRPKVLNALNRNMVEELEHAFEAFATHATVRVIVLRGAGEKAFAAGADINELADADAQEGETLSRATQRSFRRIETLGRPVIAAVNGYALGGGCELAMACTLRVAGEAARFGQPEIKLGLIPGYGGSQRLPRLVGRGAALKMLLTGSTIDAAEAHRLGLVDEVVPGDSNALLERCLDLAGTIAQMPRLAVAGVLDAVDRGADLMLDDAIALEAQIFGRLCSTEDKREGTRAFLEKREPRWTDR